MQVGFFCTVSQLFPANIGKQLSSSKNTAKILRSLTLLL